MNAPDEHESATGIAIVGMACRFPGSANLEEFWDLLCRGLEAIAFLSDEDLKLAGVPPGIYKSPNYVRAKGLLPGIDLFDAGFFGFSPREAELTDPQHRLFLECAWTALEDAGYDPDSYSGTVGVFAGAGWNSYMLFNLASHRGLFESDAGHQVLLGNEKDNLTTRVSYKLNLKGPSVAVQTGCSTSLVATAIACQSLLNYQCDLALAGGVSIMVPQGGYLFRPGGILSPDGHCRAFDASARGTVVGSGVGVVVLKRLDDAVADGDSISAVIKAAATNNDGAVKLGYTAPSLDGQAKVILEAQAIAGVSPKTITYVEAHGTGTALGDPIEVAALTKAFRHGTSARNFCALGSVKTNLGHLDAAAGVAGLIKTTLSLQHRLIPPSLHFEKPNPEIDFADSPFRVNTSLTPWETGSLPRRAGVSSFGLGGTNAHVILEEAPVLEPPPDEMPALLVMSGRTNEALEKITTQLADHLRKHPELNLADVAHTLQVGRKAFAHRRFAVCRSHDEAIAALQASYPRQAVCHSSNMGDTPVTFMFTGQGAQYPNMARGLYEAEPVFRREMDLCFALLASRCGLDLRAVLYPDGAGLEQARERLRQTENAQPALFVVEYAMARMWMSWGIAMGRAIGHSIGEYVAATLAGVFALEEALSLVVSRGRLMQGLPRGSMLAIPLSKHDVSSLLGPGVSLAALNEPSSCVVSGDDESVDTLRRQLENRGIACQRIETTHAFHSPMMEPILDAFADCVERVRRRPPVIPFVSNVTGQWITAAEATDVRYWARHIRQPVRFEEGLHTLMAANHSVFLEIGPGQTLSNFAKRHRGGTPDQIVLSTLAHERDYSLDVTTMLDCLGRLWLAGVRVDWQGRAKERRRRRVRLPTYPFERQRYWIEPAAPPEKARSDDSWQGLADAVQQRASAAMSTFDRQAYLRSRAHIDKLCMAYIKRAIQQLGGSERPPDKDSVDLWLDQSGVVPRYRRLAARLVFLSQQDQLPANGDSLNEVWLPACDEVEALAREAQREGADRDWLDLLHACGRALPEVLLGRQEPLQLFSSVLDRGAGQSHPQLALDREYSAMLRSGLEHFLKGLRAQVRILEIGAGTGMATADLLSVLPPERAQYVFTDIGKFFLARARQKFGRYPCVRYGILDIDRSPGDQGYGNHSYDVIVAVNSLHVTKSIGQTLEHIRSLLAPGGVLLIWETTRPSLDFLISYALLMNPIADGERSQGNPFLSRSQWIEALRAQGFTCAAGFPENDVLGQHVLIAQEASASLSGGRSVLERTSSGPAEPVGVSLVKKTDIGDWFHIPSWKRTGHARAVEPFKATRCLVFVDPSHLGRELARGLTRRGHKVVTVEPGEEFRSRFNCEYTINARRRDDYRTVLRELRPERIVYLWGTDPSGEVGLDVHAGSSDFQSLLLLAQAVGDSKLTGTLEITIVTHNQQDVTGEEDVVPEKALTLALGKLIPLEYPNVLCRSVDVPLSNGQTEPHLIQQLLDELDSGFADRVVAYRGAHRWVPIIEPIRLQQPADAAPRLRKNGVYLITGGLGRIGLTIAEYLAKTVAAKLILTGRSAVPRSKAELRGLEAMGAEVQVEAADVADLAAMRAAVTRAQERFGSINGVIHSAGVLGEGAIQHKTQEHLDQVLRPKVLGALVLDNIFKDAELDFLVLFSSLSAVKPGFGQVAYSAANNFLDAFVHTKAAGKHRFTTCISWDVWQGQGMAYDAVAPRVLQGLKEMDFKQRGILPDEGIEVFRRVLANKYPHVLVCTSDYLKSAEDDLSRLYLGQLSQEGSYVSHCRPNLSAAYVGPATETEERLARMWQELLGISEIGVDDNFFELGGDSLIGTQLISRLEAAFGVRLPMNTLYAHSTVRSMSAVIEEVIIRQSSSEQFEEALRKVSEGGQNHGTDERLARTG